MRIGRGRVPTRFLNRETLPVRTTNCPALGAASDLCWAGRRAGAGQGARQRAGRARVPAAVPVLWRAGGAGRRVPRGRRRLRHRRQRHGRRALRARIRRGRHARLPRQRRALLLCARERAALLCCSAWPLRSHMQPSARTADWVPRRKGAYHRALRRAGIIQKGAEIPCPVDADGRFTPEVTAFAGRCAMIMHWVLASRHAPRQHAQGGDRRRG